MVTAAKICGCRAVGVETVGVQVHKAWKLVESEGVGKLATIKQMDAFDVDLRSATVVFLYLLPKGEHPMCRIASLTCAFSHCPHARTLSLSHVRAGNRSLSEKLRRELAPGTRVVTYIFRYVCMCVVTLLV